MLCNEKKVIKPVLMLSLVAKNQQTRKTVSIVR